MALANITNNVLTDSGTSLSSLATQTYVGTQIANLVASSPATLDTLNELATALGNDPNFATTVSSAIGSKQAQLNGTGFVKVVGTTVSYDNSTYLTGITSGQVTTALGFTPYNSTNPSAYISGINSGMVVTALGYTPYNATNPNGYITGYTETDTLASVTSRGATTSNAITISGIDSALKVQHDGTSTAWRGRLGSFNSSADKASFLGNYTGRPGVFGHNNALSAWAELYVNTLGIYGQGDVYLSWFTYVKGNGNDTNYSIWHAGNLTNLNQLTNGPGYITSSALSGYLPLTGGTLSGILTTNAQLAVADNIVIYGNNKQIQWNAAASADLFISAIPGTRTIEIRNGNAGSPNYAACGLITGYATFTANVSVQGNLTVSGSGLTGGGIILADDGDIVDLNDAYCSMRFSYGVRIFSANRGGSPVITLGSNGVVTATTFSGALSGNATTATTAGALSSMNISQFTNNSGYLTSITSGNVTTALGYTPYNSSNPSGYIANGASNVNFFAGFTAYTSDGLFSANARPITITTPNGDTRIRLGYNDYGGGQYYGRIGFNGPTTWSIGHTGSAGNEFSIGTGFRGDYFKITQSGDYIFESGSGGTSGKVVFKTADNGDLNKYIMQEGYWTVIGTHSNEGFRVKDHSGNILLNVAGATNGYPLRVGIGTITPGYKLDVNGTAGFGTTTRTEIGNAASDPLSAGVNYGIFHNSGVGLGIASGAGGPTQGIAFWNHNGSSFFRSMTITGSTGNVGIGTTSPIGKLQMNGGQAIFASSNFNGTTTGGSVFVFSDDNNGGKIWAQKDGNQSWGYLALQPAGGNVGIGTTSPGSRLDVVSSTTQIADFSSPLVDGLVNIRIYNSGQTTASGTSPAAIELVAKRGSSTHGRHAWIGAEGVDGTTFRTQIKFKIRPEDSPYQWSTLPTQMVIDGNGNVGIGTTSPNRALHVVGGIELTSDLVSTKGGTTFRIGYDAYIGNSAVNLFNESAVPLAFGTNATERMRITSGGNVGIGTPSPTNTLHILTSGNEGIFLQGTSGGVWMNMQASGGQLHSIGAQVGGMGFYNRTSSLYRLFVTDGGKIALGGTTPSLKLSIYETGSTISGGNINFSTQAQGLEIFNNISGTTNNLVGCWFSTGPHKAGIASGRTNAESNWAVDLRFFVHGPEIANLDGTFEKMRLGGDGTLVVTGDVVAYGSPSDLRLKTIKEKVPNALKSILKLNGYRFDWKKTDHLKNYKEDIGVIAQEVAEVLPELAKTNEDGFMSVRYQGLTAVLIEAVKEQQTQIESQKSEIDELKDLVKQLINR